MNFNINTSKISPIGFDSLPYELNLQIMSHLTRKDLFNLFEVFSSSKDCYSLRPIFLDNRLWRKFCSNTLRDLLLEPLITKGNNFAQPIIYDSLSKRAESEFFLESVNPDENLAFLDHRNRVHKQTLASLITTWSKIENIQNIDFTYLFPHNLPLQEQPAHTAKQVSIESPIDVYKCIFSFVLTTLTINQKIYPQYLLKINPQQIINLQLINSASNFHKLYDDFHKYCYNLLAYFTNNINQLSNASNFLFSLELSNLLILASRQDFSWGTLVNQLVKNISVLIQPSIAELSYEDYRAHELKISIYAGVLDQILDAYLKVHSIDKKLHSNGQETLPLAQDSRETFFLSPHIPFLTKELLLRINESLQTCLQGRYIILHEIPWTESSNAIFASYGLSRFFEKLFKLIVSNSTPEEAINLFKSQPCLAACCLHLLPKMDFTERLDFISELYENLDYEPNPHTYSELWRSTLNYLKQDDFNSLDFLGSPLLSTLTKCHPDYILKLLNTGPKQELCLKKREIVEKVGNERLRELALLATANLNFYSEELHKFCKRFLANETLFTSQHKLRLLASSPCSNLNFLTEFLKNIGKTNLSIDKEDLPLFTQMLEMIIPFHMKTRVHIISIISSLKNFLITQGLEEQDINGLIIQAAEIFIDASIPYSNKNRNKSNFFRARRQILADKILILLPQEERKNILEIFDKKTNRTTGRKRSMPSNEEEPASKRK